MNNHTSPVQRAVATWTSWLFEESADRSLAKTSAGFSFGEFA
jgi:hypothetical protein